MSLTPSAFPIFKVSATGNDFLLVDLLHRTNVEEWQKEFGGESRSALARLWCDRHEGLGADGLVVLEKAPHPLDFAWDFYNSDGGSAEMCGNAARAVSLYVQRAENKNIFTFGTAAGDVEAKVESPEHIEVQLPAIAESEWNQTAVSLPVHYDFVRAGVPHVVLTVRQLSDRNVMREVAHTLKNEPRFRKDGVNVTFVRDLGGDKIESVTFERGVEDFTLSCGTGAIAAAFSRLRGEEKRKIEVQVPGGQLFVVWKNGRPHLRGPAKIVAAMHVIRP